MARVIQHAQQELEIITGDLTHMARHSMPYIAYVQSRQAQFA